MENLDLAITMAEAAINSGAEIIKHQTHIPDEEMSFHAKHQVPGNSDKSIYDIISECTLTEQEELKLMQHIIDRGVIFLSTPYCIEAVKRLEKFDVPAFKVGSGECNNIHLMNLFVS